MLKTLPALAVAYCAGFVLALFWIISGTPRSWSVSIPDTAHTYGIRFSGGSDLFFRPALGWFVEHGALVCVGLLIATAVVEVVGRVRRP